MAETRLPLRELALGACLCTGHQPSCPLLCWPLGYISFRNGYGPGSELCQVSSAALGAPTTGSIAYHITCENIYGSTLGKLVFSLAVVQEDGSTCRFKGAFIRSFVLSS